MSGINLRRKFARQFSKFDKYNRLQAWSVFTGFLISIAAAIAFGHYLLQGPTNFWSVILMIATAVFIGTRLRGLNNIVHECTHYTFSRHKPDNSVIGKLCAVILTGSFEEYKRDHLSHHAHLGDYEHDGDLKQIERFGLHEPLTPKTLRRHILTPLLMKHLPVYASVNVSRADGTFYIALKFVYLTALVVFTVYQPWTALFFVLIPLFYIFPTINYWTDCFDHAGVVGVKDELEASRNVLAPPPLRLLFFPRNDCYHLVHHLFPQVPARHLDVAHQELTKDPSYSEQPLAVRPIHKGAVKTLKSAPSS